MSSIQTLPLPDVALSVAAAALDTVLRIVADARFERRNPLLAERLEDIANSYQDISEWLSNPAQQGMVQDRPDVDLFELRRSSDDERSLLNSLARLRSAYPGEGTDQVGVKETSARAA